MEQDIYRRDGMDWGGKTERGIWDGVGQLLNIQGQTDLV